MTQLVILPFLMMVSHSVAPFKAQLFHFCFSSLLMHLDEQWMMVKVSVSLTPMWETRIMFLAAGFTQAQHLLLLPLLMPWPCW